MAAVFHWINCALPNQHAVLDGLVPGNTKTRIPRSGVSSHKSYIPLSCQDFNLRFTPTVILGLPTLEGPADTTWCYVCDIQNVDNTACPSIIKCPDHQMCYLQKYITVKGQTSYRSGCQNKTICNSYSKRKATVGVEPVVCEACCDRDRCNNRLCGGKSNVFPTAVCYACPATSDPTQCKAAMHCGRFDKCLEYSYHVPQTNQIMYYQGCSTKQRCDALALSASTPHQGGFLFQHQAWYNTTCCDGYMCNDGTALMATATATPST